MEDNRPARRRAWVAASNAFIENLDADVVCPENMDAKLSARFVQARPDAVGGELIITCPGCGAETTVRLAEGLPSGNRQGSPRASGPTAENGLRDPG
ncbi:MAG: hypothetical protein ACRDS9_13620 [Pseudonocardiaceae bacterium]